MMILSDLDDLRKFCFLRLVKAFQTALTFDFSTGKKAREPLL